jgi:hypothetical protein
MIVDFKEFTPADDMFTSKEEMNQIERNFELAGRSKLDLQNLRDFVVLMYRSWMQESRQNDMDLFDKQMAAMQSITAVIDYYKYNA